MRVCVRFTHGFPFCPRNLPPLVAECPDLPWEPAGLPYPIFTDSK
jgi:hypothetical protein